MPLHLPWTWRKALANFSKAVELDPDHRKARLQIAKLYLAGGAHDRAREEMSKVNDTELAQPLLSLLDFVITRKK